MRRILVFLPIVLILLTYSAVYSQEMICETLLSVDEGDLIFCRKTTPTPTVTNTSTPTATLVVLPTATPTKLALRDFPLCPDHDVMLWHGTIDYLRQCHYDHSHGDDPALGNETFGDWVFGERTISYPHASSPAENAYDTFIDPISGYKKHAGYFYLVRQNLPDSPVALPNWNTKVDAHVRDFRVQVHFWGKGDTKVRFHSVYYEIRVQNKLTGQYGIIKTGGLMDTGILELYKLQWLPIPSVDPDFNTYKNYLWYPGYNEGFGKTIDPYRGYKQTCEQIESRFWNPNFWSPTFNMGFPYTSLSNDVLWSLAPNVFGYNRIAGVSVEKYDAPDCIRAAPLDTADFTGTNYTVEDICTLAEKPNCRLNGTEVGAFMVFVTVPAEWDQSKLDINRNVGIVSMQTYTNNKQELVEGCKEVSYDCIPLILENMPVGQAFYQKSGNGKTDLSEFDLTPTDHTVNGKWESWHRQ